MNPNKKISFIFLLFLLAILLTACLSSETPTLRPNPMPGLAGTWHAPFTGEVFEIDWQSGQYVVVSCTWNKLSYSITSQSWTGSSLTWSYFDQAISQTVTVTTASLNSDSLDVNVSINDGSSRPVTLLRGDVSTVTPSLDTTPIVQAITPIMPASEISILTEVLKMFDGRIISAGVEKQDNTTSFFCYSSADAGYTVSMTNYQNEATAHTEFEARRGDNPLLCFHSYDLYQTHSSNPMNQFITQEVDVWQAGQWIVSINTSYDYGYFHFTTADFSEAVYTSSVENNLFPSGTCP